MTDSDDSAQGNTMTRRTLLKTVGAAAGGATALKATENTAIDPIGDAKAIDPALIVGGVFGASGIATSWLLRDDSPLSAETASDGLSASALEEEAYNAFRVRRSTNRSTHTDNQNIVQNLDDSLYSEGKVAAIQAINNEKSESEVTSAAQTEVDTRITTIKRNYLKSWNEAAQEFVNYYQGFVEHSNLTADNYFSIDYQTGSWGDDPTAFPDSGNSEAYTGTAINTHTLPDGTTIDVTELQTGTSTEVSPLSTQDLVDAWVWYIGIGNIGYLRYYEWRNTWDEIETVAQAARDGLSTWVSNIYNDVQSGDLDPAELLSASELADISTDNTEFPQAYADLAALNVDNDLGGNAVINPANVDAEIRGALSVTGEVTFTVGTTVDPSSDSYSYYFTYDVSLASGEWLDYETGIDGGVITFTTEPYTDTEFVIETNNDETATALGDNFTDNGDGTWSYDASSQLEDDLADITFVQFRSPTDGTHFETVELQNPFDVVNLEDADGTQIDSTVVDSPTPHDDTNYITKEEWDQRLQRQEELIDDHESATGGGFITDSNRMLAGGAALVGAWLLGK